MNWKKAQILQVTPSHSHNIRSGWYTNIFKASYIPIVCYPPHVEILDNEIGAIGKLSRKGEITKILRRIVVVGRRKKSVQTL